MYNFLRIFKIPDLRSKVLFVLVMLVIFRLAATIPIPGVDTDRLKAFFSSNQFFGLLNIFSGGALDNLSVVMLGVGPYITASIIMQLLTMIFPPLKEMYYEAGEAGRQKFNQYSRMLTVPLAMLQGFGLMTLLVRQQVLQRPSLFEMATNVIIVTAGSLFLMWIGELISEKGIGNGISLLIFSGIVSSLPQVVRQLFFTFDPSQIPTLIMFVAVGLVVISAVVFITEAERPIPVSYAKRVRGTRIFGGVSSYLPLRVNQAGVIPIIFALSIILFPSLIGNFLVSAQNQTVQAVGRVLVNFTSSQAIYGSLYFALVFLFTYFYTAVTFDPQEIASNLQKQGGFVPGIRPGPPTASLLSNVLKRITLFGAVFLGVIAVLPLLVQSATGITALTIGGTSLLIVVSVVLETVKQIEAQLSMREYET